MVKFITNFLIWTFFLAFLFGSLYYFGILQVLSAQVAVVNTKFLVYIPIEYRLILAFFMFVLVWIFIENRRAN